MKNSKKWLLTALAVAAVVTTTLPKKAHATGQTYQAQAIQCIDNTGVTYSYGINCVAGSNFCTPDPCYPLN